MKLSSLILFILLCGCATDHPRCVEYMWVPTMDGGGMHYNMQRPVCVEWSKE